VIFEDNLAYLEALSRTWQEDPAALDPSWQSWLAAVERGEVPIRESMGRFIRLLGTTKGKAPG